MPGFGFLPQNGGQHQKDSPGVKINLCGADANGVNIDLKSA